MGILLIDIIVLVGNNICGDILHNKLPSDEIDELLHGRK